MMLICTVSININKKKTAACLLLFGKKIDMYQIYQNCMQMLWMRNLKIKGAIFKESPQRYLSVAQLTITTTAVAVLHVL